MYSFPKTAAQYGRELKAAGIKPPKPVLCSEFLRKISDRIYIFRVGKRSVKNVFLLVNRSLCKLKLFEINQMSSRRDSNHRLVIAQFGVWLPTKLQLIIPTRS